MGSFRGFINPGEEARLNLQDKGYCTFVDPPQFFREGDYFTVMNSCGLTPRDKNNGKLMEAEITSVKRDFGLDKNKKPCPITVVSAKRK